MHNSAIINQDAEYIIKKSLNYLKKLEGSKILITGACGMIPAYFLDVIFLLNRDYFNRKCKVFAYDFNIVDEGNRLFYITGSNDFIFKQVDVSKQFEIPKDINYIIHAASKASPRTYLKDPIGTIYANINGTKTVLNYMKNNSVESFMYFSSGEIYGDPPDEAVPTPEEYRGCTDHLSERSCYVESKRFSETLCINYYRKYNIPVKIVRPVHIFGPGIRLNDGRVWADFINNAIEGKDIMIMSDGKASRGFCYIADAMKQFWTILLAGKNGEVYNIGNDEEEITIKKLAEIIVNLVDNNISYKIMNNMPSHLKGGPKRSCPDMSKIKRDFDIRNEIKIEEGMKRTIEWVKNFYV